MNAVTLPLRAEQGAAIVNGLSVDVEDWFQVGAFESVIERDDWNSLADRVDRERNVAVGDQALAQDEAFAWLEFYFKTHAFLAAFASPPALRIGERPCRY